jgi:medium-chain acyl-[acyl-carrier-protein] hydrolase
MHADEERRRATRLWLPMLRQRPNPRLRLFCCPYAGGSAATFVEWADRLPPTIDVRPVQVPGRWNRVHESPLTHLEEIVATLVPLMRPLLDRPFAFFGHSLGALLAFELARDLRYRGGPMPVHLYVSGRRAPQIPDLDLPAADLPDSAFITELRRFNGTPDEVLQSAELMALVLPTLRADFAMCRNYVYAPGPPLDCPVTVLCGRDDIEHTGGYLEGWRAQTTGACTIVTFPGDHFYLRTASGPLLRTLRESLSHHDRFVAHH